MRVAPNESVVPFGRGRRTSRRNLTNRDGTRIRRFQFLHGAFGHNKNPDEVLVSQQRCAVESVCDMMVRVRFTADEGACEGCGEKTVHGAPITELEGIVGGLERRRRKDDHVMLSLV